MKENSPITGMSGDRPKKKMPARVPMMFLYDLFLGLYVFSIRLYGRFNAKAGKWARGRKNWEQNFAAALKLGEKRVWIHCSSVGEFEQAKPLLQALRSAYPEWATVVTFFSPSGYEASLKSPLIDYLFYLPADNRKNARVFLNLVNPTLAIFVKYEFWYHYLAALNSREVPTILVSGAFRAEQPFFAWYGGLFRDMLHCFSYFFLQDEESVAQLNKVGNNWNMIISGDTRYDRVTEIARNIQPLPEIENFKGSNHLLIAGSTWPADEALLKECISTLPANWKLIIAPHEVDAAHIRKIEQLFPGDTIRYSALDAGNPGFGNRILIIDNIGLLSRLFVYGDIAYIGGGFAKGGIHNILEPAVFGVPVIFGPVYEKFVEAKEMVARQIVFPVSDASACKAVLRELVINENYRASVTQSLKTFMARHTGATGKIMEVIRTRNWLY